MILAMYFDEIHSRCYEIINNIEDTCELYVI